MPAEPVYVPRMPPPALMARVYRQDGSETIVAAEAALEGEEVLPGFGCPLETIL
jgi:hypothetical protein